MNILFVCRYNRFRSRVAEAYFRKINKNKNINVKSAGLIRGMPIKKETIDSVRKFGLNISGKPNGLTSEVMVWQNVTVIVADDVPPQVFDRNKEYGKKVIVWKIKDIEKGRTKEMVAEEIIKKVDQFNKNLERLK